LEYILEEGSRGERYAHVEGLFQKLTGAESAIVVNNNAAGILLVLHTLAAGKEVIVSRGELVEIGGSFRIPEVLKLGGVKLVEVGTTNRTHLDDYREAINENTGLILKVHTSNYRVMGFTSSVNREELAKLAHEQELPFVEDLGSGALLDLSVYGLKDEPTIGEALKAGVDVISFSGDKLLGGPQAGVILGKADYLARMKKNHLMRALRIDKFTVAALEATLREYLRPDAVMQNIPIYAMLTASLAELKSKGEQIQAALAEYSEQVEITVQNTVAQMGGGSLPGQEIPSIGLAINFPRLSATETEEAFRTRVAVPVLGYILKDQFILDLRTLLPGDEEIIIEGIKQLIQETPQ
jgi:L-seryl-tRNA(Ser) seleniumtransferase